MRRTYRTSGFPVSPRLKKSATDSKRVIAELDYDPGDGKVRALDGVDLTVEQGEVDVGVVPIENSIEGMVNFTQDALAFDHDLLIQREIVIDIEHCLLGRATTDLTDVGVIYSIPVATAQQRRPERQPPVAGDHAELAEPGDDLFLDLPGHSGLLHAREARRV